MVIIIIQSNQDWNDKENLRKSMGFEICARTSYFWNLLKLVAVWSSPLEKMIQMHP